MFFCTSNQQFACISTFLQTPESMFQIIAVVAFERFVGARNVHCVICCSSMVRWCTKCALRYLLLFRASLVAEIGMALFFLWTVRDLASFIQ